MWQKNARLCDTEPMDDATHELWSRPLYEEGDWEKENMGITVEIDGETIILRVPEKVRLHDERQYQLRRLSPRPD
jgi:hypothetical protein